MLSYLLFQLKNLLYKTKQYDKSLIICEKTSVLEEKLAKNDKKRKKFVIENQIFLCKIYFITKEIRKEKKKTILRRIINSLKSLISTENEYKLKYSSKLEIIEKQLIDLN